LKVAITVWYHRALCDLLLCCYACVCFINKPKHVAPVGKQTILSENTFVINDTRVRSLRVPFCLRFFPYDSLRCPTKATKLTYCWL